MSAFRVEQGDRTAEAVLEQEVPFLKYTELAGRLVLWKKEDDMLWSLEAPSQALQQCLMDASAAIQAFKAKKKGLSKVPSSGRRGFLPHSASSPDGLGRGQRSSPHPEGRLRAIQKVASDSRQDQADDGFRRMRALVCLGRAEMDFGSTTVRVVPAEVGIDLALPRR